MAIIDCENVDTAYHSIEEILGISKNELNKLFGNIDLERYYKKNPNCYYDGAELLWILIRKKYKHDYCFDGCYWFHLTKVNQQTSFKEGILPLNQILDRIWDFLFSLVGEDFDKNEWKKFINSSVSFQYNLKVSGSMHWGPYAMLVRDIAFIDAGNHDYLRVPEIVEDICLSFQKQYGIDLLQKYFNNTRSCIVKFYSKNIKEHYLYTALYYLYCIYRGEELNLHCNTCYNGQSEKVSFKDIIKVEYLKG